MISISLTVYFLAVIALTATMVILSRLLNPAAPKNRTNILPFESGIIPTGSTDLRWNVNYYLVAILFVIFDIEAVFLYVWVGVVVDAGWAGFLATTAFIASLLAALVYQWRMGVLEWGHRQLSHDRQTVTAARQAAFTQSTLSQTPLPAGAADSTQESL